MSDQTGENKSRDLCQYLSPTVIVPAFKISGDLYYPRFLKILGACWTGERLSFTVEFLRSDFLAEKSEFAVPDVSASQRLAVFLIHLSGIVAFWIPGLCAAFWWGRKSLFLRTQGRRAAIFQTVWFLALAGVAAARAFCVALIGQSNGIHAVAGENVYPWLRISASALAAAVWMVPVAWLISTLAMAFWCATETGRGKNGEPKQLWQCLPGHPSSPAQVGAFWPRASAERSATQGGNLLLFLVAGVTYLLMAGGLTLPDLIRAGSGAVIGHANRDTTAFLWYFAWWPHALASRINPFYIHVIWQPAGVNAAWITSIPALALLFAPVTHFWGATVALNLALLLSPALGAWMAFGMNLELGTGFWPSLLGGWIFGFSVYETTQMQYDLNLAITFAVPAGVWLFLRRRHNRMGRKAFIILTALLWCFEFGVFTETFATTVMLGTFAIFFTLTLAPKGEDFCALRQVCLDSLWALLLAIAILLPIFIGPLLHGYNGGEIWSRSTNSVDLASVVMPSQHVWLGTTFARPFWAAFHEAASTTSQVGYLGLPLAVLLAWYFKRYRDTFHGRFLLLLFSVTVLLSLGPRLKVLGNSIWLLMPWFFVAHAPLLEKALPFRIFSCVTLIAGAAAALWLHDSPVSVRLKLLLSALIVLTLLPNFRAGIGANRYANPAFFKQGLCHRYLQPGETVLILPFRSRTPVMLWQEESGFTFSMINGFTGWPPADFKIPGGLLTNLALRAPPTRGYTRQLKQLLRRNHVGSVILTGQPDAVSAAALAPLHCLPIHVGGVWLYSVATHWHRRHP